MRCWLSAAQAAYHSFPSLPPTKTRSLRCTAFFPPKPLRGVSAGALLGAVIKAPVLHFRHFRVGVVSLPSGRFVCVGTTPRGVYFGRKTVFSEWVLCADERAVPSCTQCFLGTSVWGCITTLWPLCLCRNNPARGLFQQKKRLSQSGCSAPTDTLFPPAHSAFSAFLHGGGIITLGVRFMPLKHWTRRSYGGLFAVFMPPRCSPCAG